MKRPNLGEPEREAGGGIWDLLVCNPVTNLIQQYLGACDIARLAVCCRAFLPLRGRIEDLRLSSGFEALGHFPALRTLTCSDLGDHGLSQLAKALRQHCPALQTLDLNGGWLGGEGMLALVAALKSRAGCNYSLRKRTVGQPLHTLRLPWLCSASARMLAQELPSICSAMRTLDLNSSYLGAEGGRALAAALPGACPVLRKLDLSHTGLDAKALAKAFMRGACPMLQELNFTNNAGVRALAEGLGACLTLKKLDLGCNWMGVRGAQALADAFRAGACPALEELDLRHNGLKEGGARVLADAFRAGACPALRELNLRHNNLRAAGARALAGGLGHALRTLRLCSNDIGDEGAWALAEEYPAASLETLYMSGNSIGDSGAQAVAEMLREWPALRALDLSLNGIGQEGAQVLAVVVRNYPTSVMLCLDHNKIGKRDRLLFRGATPESA